MSDYLAKIKRILTSGLNLANYDANKNIFIADDAINLSLGAIILHKESSCQLNAIAHASRTLVLAEKEYSLIDKEA